MKCFVFTQIEEKSQGGISMNQAFFMPTKVVMGDDCIKANRALLNKLGKTALIVTGARSAKANGSLADITEALSLNGQSYQVFDKVMSNPTIACVYEGAAYAREIGADFVMAAGGGSIMDAAKAIALLAKQDISEENLFSGQYTKDVLPMAFVPTTAGTGSEVTPFSILTNDKAKTKTSIATPLLFPTLALLDGKYMAGLPRRTTANTAVDAFSHCVEGLLSNKASSISDCLALEGIRLIAACFDAIKTGTVTPKQRSDLLCASMLGGMVIANTGTAAVHAMGYSLTYFKHIDHGLANGLLMGRFLALIEKDCPGRMKLILASAGLPSVAALTELLAELLEKPEHLTEEEINLYAGLAMKAKNMANCLVMPTEEALREILRASL